MPYEDDYKMWLEKMLIESNPDWVCDGMYDKEITRNWCVDYCGEDDEYITPKCLHMYYHHIERADHKTENSSEKPNNSTISKMEQVDKDINVRSKDEPQTDCIKCKHFKKGRTILENGHCHTYMECMASECPYEPKDEPQTEHLEQFRVGLEYHTDTTHFGKTKGESVTTNKVEDEPQTDCAWK